MLYTYSDVKTNDIRESLTERDTAAALKVFAQALKERPEKFDIKGASPLDQNAYISSCGDFAGVYFPNSSITASGHPAYKVLCLSLDKSGAAVLILSLKDESDRPAWAHSLDLSEYIAVSLDYIIASNAERETRKKLESYARDYEAQIYALTNLKRAYKKDGAPFARLGDNFPGANIKIDRYYISGFVSSVTVSGNIGKGGAWQGEIYLYPHFDEKDKKADITADDIESLLKTTAQKLIKHLDSIRQQLKAMHAAFLKVEKTALKARAAIVSIPEYSEFNGEFNSTTSLGYALEEYAQKLVKHGC